VDDDATVQRRDLVSRQVVVQEGAVVEHARALAPLHDHAVVLTVLQASDRHLRHYCLIDTAAIDRALRLTDAVHPQAVVILGDEFSSGHHIVGESKDRPRVLLGRLPAPTGARQHQPAHGIGHDGIVRGKVHECLQDDGRGARVGVHRPWAALGLFPMGAGSAQDRLSHQFASQRVQPRRFLGVQDFQRHRQVCPGIERHPLATIIQGYRAT